MNADPRLPADDITIPSCNGCGGTEGYRTWADGFEVVTCCCGIAQSVRPVEHHAVARVFRESPDELVRVVEAARIATPWAHSHGKTWMRRSLGDGSVVGTVTQQASGGWTYAVGGLTRGQPHLTREKAMAREKAMTAADTDLVSEDMGYALAGVRFAVAK